MNPPGPQSSKALRVGYLVSRFPDYSEAFVRYEIREVRRHVSRLLVLPLVESAAARSPDALRESGLGRADVVPPPAALSLHVMRTVSWTRRKNPRAMRDVVRSILFAAAAAPAQGCKWLALLPRILCLGRTACAERLGHLHAHFVGLPANAAWTINRLHGIPYSVTAHAYGLYTSKRLLRKKLSAASFGVAVSDYSAALAEGIVPPRNGFRWHVVRNGIPLDAFVPPDSAERPGDSRLHVLFVGRLVPQKGAEVLVDACRILAERGVDFECTLVGSGPLLRALRRRAGAAGVEERVVFAGVLTGSDLRRAYSRADVFALPCVQLKGRGGDTLPVVLTEAMAMGLPVVSTPVGGIPELITDGESGRLVESGAPEALADVVAGFASDPEERRRLGRRAREKVAADYDVRLTGSELARLFCVAHGLPFEDGREG
ncbi:glycosyltransferase family 4 protein [Verrucomicrobiota bacterium]